MYLYIFYSIASLAFFKVFLSAKVAVPSCAYFPSTVSSDSRQEILARFSFVSVVFCVLFSVFGLMDLDVKELRLEEKFREYTQETIDLNSEAITSFTGSGGTSGISPKQNKFMISLGLKYLPLSKLWANATSADLPLDPQSTWNADPSPPLLTRS